MQIVSVEIGLEIKERFRDEAKGNTYNRCASCNRSTFKPLSIGAFFMQYNA